MTISATKGDGVVTGVTKKKCVGGGNTGESKGVVARTTAKRAPANETVMLRRSLPPLPWKRRASSDA